jgi:hypothetical protein
LPKQDTKAPCENRKDFPRTVNLVEDRYEPAYGQQEEHGAAKYHPEKAVSGLTACFDNRRRHRPGITGPNLNDRAHWQSPSVYRKKCTKLPPARK